MQQPPLTVPLTTSHDIHQLLQPLRQQLIEHPVYHRIQTLAQLQVYMEHHVFAVWDFMSLIKSLQQRLTCTTVPWLPTANRLSRRLINEIVLCEESDDSADGTFNSHFEMYLSAMNQAGANTRPINKFLDLVRLGLSVPKSLRVANAPRQAESFVNNSWQIIESGKPHVIAAAFALGREEIIPEMFKALTDLQTRLPQNVSIFIDYLERHISIDGDHHKPMALTMLRELCEEDEGKQAEAEAAASGSLQARIKLWDGVVKEIDRRSNSHSTDSCPTHQPV
jgi:hypothetical protein